MCPSQLPTAREVYTPMFMSVPVANLAGIPEASYSTRQSYIFNERVLGWNDLGGCLRGKASRVRQPAVTLFAADGLPGNVRGSVLWADPTYSPVTTAESPIGAPMGVLYTLTPNPGVSLADAYTDRVGYAGNSGNFDAKRHRGKMNVAFCDGHVATVDVSPGGLADVWLAAP